MLTGTKVAGHLLKCGPKSWRIKEHTDLRKEEIAS
jgi:hypothetical protein